LLHAIATRTWLEHCHVSRPLRTVVQRSRAGGAVVGPYPQAPTPLPNCNITVCCPPPHSNMSPHIYGEQLFWSPNANMAPGSPRTSKLQWQCYRER
jgi:hypothetical protein